LPNEERVLLRRDVVSNSDQGYALPQSNRTGGEWLQLLLDLIISSGSIDDLPVEAVRKASGLDLDAFDDHQFGTAQRLTSDWNFVLKKDDASIWGPRVEFEFFPDGGGSPAMTDIAQLDLDGFVAALEQAGFAEYISYGEHGQIISHEYTRDPLKVTVLARGEGNDTGPGEPVHLCVREVIVQ
jgi:hypothetical protein